MSWFQKPEQVLVQEIDEDLVLLNLDTEAYYALNSSARRFWEVSLAAASKSAAVSKLADEFGVAEDTIRDDLETMVVELLARGLILPGPADA